MFLIFFYENKFLIEKLSDNEKMKTGREFIGDGNKIDK